MSIAFKEWAIVCAALGRGEQSIILRKGGIAEGREGFRFQHPEFYFFPTLFHEQIAKTTLPLGTPLPAAEPGMVRIELFARVEWTAFLPSLDVARRLAPFHIWKDEVIADRFRYDEPPGLSLAFLRAYRLERPWEFPDAPRYGGCRSWVTVPDAPESIAMHAVLEESIHTRRAAEVRELAEIS